MYTHMRVSLGLYMSFYMALIWLAYVGVCVVRVVWCVRERERKREREREREREHAHEEGNAGTDCTGSYEGVQDFRNS